MTKEELKQEAEKSLDKRLGTYAYIRKQDCYTNYVDGYIDSAEPREKRIAELERKLKVETELSNRLGLAYREYEQLTKEQDEHLAELEKENTELKTKKIPQLERRIASIRGSHKVDVKKLNARIEQVERLKKENAELKDYRLTTLAKQQTDMSKYALNLEHKLSWYDDQLTKAKELLKKCVCIINRLTPTTALLDKNERSLLKQAEQFLSEVEK
jgi:hypothetical protein